GPGYPPAGGQVAPGYPNGRGNPGYPPAGGPAYSGAYAGPQVLTRPPGPGYPPGSVNGRPGYGPGPGTGPSPVAGPASRPASGQQASRYPLLIGPDTGMPDQVIEGRRVLGWRRLVLLPRPPAFLRPDQ